VGARRYGSRRIEISHPDKVYFPRAGITKGELVDYYELIADRMLPYLRDRPLTQQRFPDGIGMPGFYQKEVPDYFPDWVATVTVETEHGPQRQVLCQDQATLVYLAQQGCVTPHVWLSRKDSLRCPDRLVIDLDPSGDRDLQAGWQDACFAALRLRELCAETKLPLFVMSTGSRGLHGLVPLRPEADFDDVRALARAMAAELASRFPRRLTTEARKAKRAGRLYLDIGRNAYGQTAVPPFAVRAREEAPVALPLAWEELEETGPRAHTVRDVVSFLRDRKDPWRGLEREAVSPKEKDRFGA
jgi:bifunctional non-homologous end joining protein LigD